MTPRTVIVIELIARLVSVKTVIHWTTDMSAWSLNKECELTSSDPSKKEDRRPNITIDSAPLHERQENLLKHGRCKTVSRPLDSMFCSHCRSVSC